MNSAAPNTALSPGPLTRAALDLAPRRVVIGLLGGVMVAGGALAPTYAPNALSAVIPAAQLALGLVVVGATFLAVVGLVSALVLRHRRAGAAMAAMVADFAQYDAAPVFTTDSDGLILYANTAAHARFQATVGGSLVDALHDAIAAPASMLYRLQNKAMSNGAASEDHVVRNGTTRLSVHRVGAQGFLWRFDDVTGATRPAYLGETTGLPTMAVSSAGTILYMNDALRKKLGGRETMLDRVFTDLPLRPGEVHTITGPDGNESTLVFEAPLSGGRREIYLLPPPERPMVEPAGWGVIESLPVPLLKLDPAGQLLTANRRARLLLGAEDAVGLHLSDLVEGLGRPISDWLNEAWAGRNLGRTETVRASRAEERFLHISLEQIRDSDGPTVIAVLNDATALKTLETQFVQSQKMQAIGQLAGGVAHDFNNLLTAISGHCDLLLLRHDVSDQDYADLTQISQNANRAAALVGQLLAFSRKQTLRPEVLDLAEALGDLTHLLGRLVGETVRLDYRSDPHVLPVRADKRQLEQVVMNLVVNARDAMPSGGQIRLALNNVYFDQALKRDQAVVPAGEYVAIRVIDEGTGIPSDKLRKIFEPFYTTKPAGQGTGLGLSMAYGIVKQSGGFIFADSAVGSGTTFTLYFPVYHGVATAGMSPEADAGPEVLDLEAVMAAPAEKPVLIADLPPLIKPRRPAEPKDAPTAAPKLPAPTHVLSDNAGGNVLLVEDEAPVRAFASRALRMRGYTVIEAENAEEALKTLEDDALHIDIFVTDVVMPGMDGPTWVAQALERRPGVKVVFVSGYAEDSVSEQQARIPNSVFLPKPFSLSDLTATVSGQLQ